MAAVAPQKRQCSFASSPPARASVSPRLRQAAGALWAMRGVHTTKNKVDSFLQSEKLEKNNFVSLKIK
jgi:hypothetical protein